MMKNLSEVVKQGFPRCGFWSQRLAGWVGSVLHSVERSLEDYYIRSFPSWRNHWIVKIPDGFLQWSGTLVQAHIGDLRSWKLYDSMVSFGKM